MDGRIIQLFDAIPNAHMVDFDTYNATPEGLRGHLTLGGRSVRFVIDDTRIIDVPGQRAVVDNWRRTA